MSELVFWAHRGASARAPENTLAAFRAAEEDGADGIEMDVHLSRDGVPVIIHDDTLDRTSDGRGAVERSPLAALRRLDAGGWFAPAFAGEPLPSLAEVLDWAGTRLRINLEIKSSLPPQVLLRVLADFPDSRLLVSSLDLRLLAALRRAEPALALAVVCDSRLWRRSLRRAVALGAESFHPRRGLAGRPLAAACHAAGLAVFPWTVDRGREARSLVRAGADGFFTNDPAGLRSSLEGWRGGRSPF